MASGLARALADTVDLRIATDSAGRYGCESTSRGPDSASQSGDASRDVPMKSKVICQHCEKVIGVYEPLIVVVGGQARETSRAADPTLPLDCAEHYHRDCYLERSETSSV